MRMSRLRVVAVFVGVAACGEVKEGGIVDAGPDAAALVTGLGQKCNSAMNDCPVNTPHCIGYANTTQFCTLLCLANGTGTTDGQAQFASITPPPNNAACLAAFTGTVGRPFCGAIAGYMPADNPLQANKTYTEVNVVCLVLCDANNACPVGMAPNMASSSCRCLPL